ncbi:decapping enzyme, scavenger isoform X2 [Lycorma delicatula]|uniref:decapping enzyme, scavenger isoform X2 n=1 Tax=Lycorma delicatula TaxID=130591 RepID=UPI003F516426
MVFNSATDLFDFSTKRVLCSSNKRKTVCLEGRFPNSGEPAIIFLEKLPISYKTAQNLCNNSILEKSYNSVHNYECTSKLSLNGIKISTIYPATQKHIKKYESQPMHIIDETSNLYINVTLPYITSESFNLKWVYNIFEHKAEEESIVYEDTNTETGFILLPDLKWNQKQIENLYLLAIVKPRNIKSLRDLTDKHIPLLLNKVIKSKYGLDESQLRIYIHYQPSYYHLHIHFTYLQYQAPGIFIGRAHLLSSVIKNLELIPDYYQKKTLQFIIKETDGLFLQYKEKGLVKEVVKEEEVVKEK